ncbi:MAG: VOC family protein [Planctomycetes bacterium]|nr:VOC family protein [Planctomycetota bacterium]
MAVKIKAIAPYLFVDDVVKSANWYRDKLGFGFDRLWGEPPCFAIVRRDGVCVMLKQMPGQVRPNAKVDPEDSAWNAYLWVEDVDAVHAEFQAKGVKIPRGLCDQEYGCRDFDIEDCNGYVLCFGQNIQK